MQVRWKWVGEPNGNENERASRERERGRERMNEQVNEHYRSTKRDVVSSDRVIKTVDWGVLEDGSTQL